MPTSVVIGLAIAGTAVSAYSSYKQGKAQKKAIASQRQAETVSRNRERRAAYRQQQIARARAVAQQASVGGLTTSSSMGGLGSLSSQYATNLGFSSQVGAINQNTGAFQQDAANWGMIGSFGQAAADIGGAMGGWTDLKNKYGGGGGAPGGGVTPVQ